jgi:6-phosphogluconate dehydrogenase
MVHNGIEYGLMQAYAEGFEIMHCERLRARSRRHLGPVDAGLGRPVVAAELAARAFKANGADLEHIKGFVADSGEGRWTVQEAIDHDVPAPVITLSLLTRFRSRQDDSYGAKVLAALRNEFGGHEVKTE